MTARSEPEGAPNLDARDESADAPAPAGRIVTVAFGLLALFGIVSLLAQDDPLRPLDPFEALGDHVEVGELPYGFRFGDAMTLSAERAYVQLVRDDPRMSVTEADEVLAGVDAARRAEAANDDGADEGASRISDTAAERERHAHEDGTPPGVIWLMRYPRASALDVLKREMKRKTEDPDGEPPKDELELTVDGGRLVWGDFDADYVQEREYTKGDHFTDVLRVNLTLGDECWILVAEWPRDYRGSTEPVARVLEALPPR